MKKQRLIKLLQFLICILPAVLYLSYFPVISFGMTGTMNLELSVPLIWLLVFDLTAIVGVFQLKKTKVIAGKWYYYLFPFFATVSLFWSSNILRGVLTLGVMWAVILALMAFVIFKKELFTDGFKIKFWKWFFGASVVACAWCFLQCILDLAGVERECSLLCLGCTYKTFGFPHPNGFAIEPQFMGNLLLAPALVSTYFFVMSKQNSINLERRPSRDGAFHNRSVGTVPKLQFRTRSVTVVKNTFGSGLLCSKLILFCLFLTTATLFLTMSRGAIYAFVVGLIFMSCYLIARTSKRKVVFKRAGLTWLIVVLSFLFTLNLQGIMTQISPTDDMYLDGISRVISQLSLGTIEIKGKENVDANREEGQNEVVENYVENFSDEAVFDGYVPESTDVRVKLTGVALELWSSDIKTMFFGVGIGGAGQALYDAQLIDSPKEIVQNEYASLLLEVGLIGIFFLIITIFLIVRMIWGSSNMGMILALIVAYGVSLCFFSGLPNALHIYLLPVLLYFVC